MRSVGHSELVELSKYITPTSAAKALKVSRQYVHRMIAAGTFSTVYVVPDSTVLLLDAEEVSTLASLRDQQIRS